MTHSEIISNIRKICGLALDIDAEQVLDIILGRADIMDNKCSGYSEVTSHWGAGEWKSVLREFYVSFQKSKLSQIFLDEYDHTMRADVVVDSQRALMEYKKAPDSFYLHLANVELVRPEDVPPRGDRTRILVSLYAAISSGENYGTVAYPPKAFIERVVCEDITPSEYLSTILSISTEDTTLEHLAAQAVANNKDLYKQMKSAYKKLVGKDVKSTAGKAVAAASVAAATTAVVAGKAARRVKKSTYTTDEEPRSSVGVASSTAIKTYGKSGVVMLLINGIATPAKLTTGISGIGTILTTEGLSGLLDALNNFGLSLLPAIGVICTVLMLFTGIVSRTSKGQLIAKLVMVVALCCTAYSVYTLIKLGIVMLLAAIRHTFSLETIGKMMVTAPFKLIKGIFS